MDVESLVVSLGLDPTEFERGLSKVSSSLNQLQRGGEAFGDGLQSAFSGQSAAMEQAARKTEQVGKKADEVAVKMQGMGNKIASSIKGALLSIVAPVTGALSIGAIVGSHMSAVANVAKQTGAYNEGLETFRKRRAELSRVTREDIELYRKSRLALLDFDLAMGKLSSSIMHSLSPVLRSGLDLLKSAAQWISSHERDIVRFLGVIAGTITGLMIPALLRMTAAMVANPITWIVAALAGLVLAIDDLFTYMRGGKSALEGFWSQFGTGAELMEKAAAVWNALRRLLATGWETAKSLAQGFFDVVGPSLNLLVPVIKNIGAVFEAVFNKDVAGAAQALVDVLTSVLRFVFTLFNDVFTAIVRLVADIFDGIANYIRSVFSGIMDFVLGVVLNIVDSMPDFFLKASGLAEWSRNTRQTLENRKAEREEQRERTPSISPSQPGKTQSAAALHVSNNETNIYQTSSTPPLPSAPVSNTTVNSEASVYNSAENQTVIYRQSVPAQQADRPEKVFLDYGSSAIPKTAELQAASVPASVTENITHNYHSEVHVSGVTVQTQATDPEGIANGLGGALENRLDFGTSIFAGESGVRK